MTKFSSVHFNNSKFNGSVNFLSAIINDAIFMDTYFSSKNTASFDEIVVKNKIDFKSTDENKKIFNGHISMNVKGEQIKGLIRFENANIFWIDKNDLKNLKKLEKQNIVKFGNGCDKYRLKKEITIPMKKKWQYLIEEMGYTFVKFFEWRGLAQLGVNVECEYQENSVLIRYYSDKDITEDKFDKMLAEEVPNFIEFLKNPNDYFEKFYQNNYSENSPTQEEHIENIETYRKGNSLYQALIMQVKHDPNFNIDKTGFSILSLPFSKNEVDLSNNKIEVHIKNEIQEIHNHYKQVDILSFGTKKYLAGGGMNIEN